jgi:putative ABC transport system ATP-binding protein
MAEKVVEAEDVHRTYRMDSIEVQALRGVSISLKRGDFAFIIGPSGSGKSTLMHLLGALEKPTKGRILFEGKDLSKFDDFQLSMLRRKRIGYVFQAFNLVPTLNALDNVLLPLIPEGISAEKRRHARELLTMMGLEKRMHHTPEKLSGGEKQRVAIARALINDPSVVFADEPTGELDSKTGNEIFDYMRRVNKEEEKTFLIVTHDTEYIKEGDLVLKIHDGKLVDHHR